MDLRTAVGSLREAGHKVTPQRIEVLRVLMSAGAPISAQAVLGRVKETSPGVSLDTVYRNLTLLTTTGLVTQINLQSKGIALFEFQGAAHHHHAICLQCGQSLCVSGCPLPTLQALPMPEGDTGFKVVSHAFEMYGYCSACQSR